MSSTKPDTEKCNWLKSIFNLSVSRKNEGSYFRVYNTAIIFSWFIYFHSPKHLLAYLISILFFLFNTTYITLIKHNLKLINYLDGCCCWGWWWWWWWWYSSIDMTWWNSVGKRTIVIKLTVEELYIYIYIYINIYFITTNHTILDYYYYYIHHAYFGTFSH
jgi:hypothetical protein